GNIQSMQIEDIENLRNEEVILYCRSGNRSGIAAMVLDQIGFTNTKNLTGGMLAWVEKFKS
ncbi:MAG: rhodanese-like domain-containing protein, partial [Ginsengibacter sp.]